MAEQDQTPESDGHKAKITAQLVYHIIVPGKTSNTGAKSKAKPKEKKETKTKEFHHTFESTKENYLSLLKTILAKHGEEKYNVTEKLTYGIKVQLPHVKKGDAVDIDTFEEYQDLVVDINKELPPKMNIFVDMSDVEKQWNKRGSHGRDDEDEDADLYDANGLSDLERELARLRGKLEKKYQNDHNAGYTYVDPASGKSYPLTPQMMKEWCCAMYDGQATLYAAPNFITNFDPANRQVALHPTRIAAGVNRPHAESEVNGVVNVVGHLATMITALTGGRPMAVTADQQPLIPATPKSTHHDTADVIPSPAIPSPTKLTRFLLHAELKLGIKNALQYESAMSRNGLGPDILHMVDGRALMDCGINKGDVLRMKAGAPSWWNGPDAKRKRVDSVAPANSQASGSNSAGSAQIDSLATPPSKKVAFERRYGDGGASRFWGPRITAGAYEKDVWLKVAGTWAPMPLGYRAVQDFEYEETEEGGEHQPDDAEDRMPVFEQDVDEAAAALLDLNPQGSHRG
ncbi:hypothetical protein B0H13DRAFT_2342055 [Mycena leptocephala]|nr:hypothetical protein B0H13DRAFT_2342055 [Mycena leptocephala]